MFICQFAVCKPDISHRNWCNYLLRESATDWSNILSSVEVLPPHYHVAEVRTFGAVGLPEEL